MNFFRLRVLNTFLLFLIGIVAGFILKDRFYPSVPAPKPYAAPYKVPEEPSPAAEEEQAAEEELPVQEEEEPEVPRPVRARAPEVSAETLDEPAPGNGGGHIVIEPAVPPTRRGDALRGAREEFFKKPSDYAGRELEMDLQIITAKRSASGWRLNFIYTAPDKRVDYLYAEAASDILGEKPDLRIGYVYTVRFLCEKGETGSGNVLAAVSPTGGKADWATGLSALE
ncbi:MAG: hypothetical protein ACYC2I_06775 [Elusimicrobiales bacterium]